MGERRGTKALELWCRRMTEGYPGVKIENMTTSWRDGLAFCAMIHHFRPDLIEFEKLNKDDVYYNNDLAFSTAERHLGIPALLDADDMASYEVPDRLSILTYLSQFYQVFASPDSHNRLSNKRPSAVAEKSSIAKPTGPPPKMAHIVGVPKRDPCQKCGLPVFLAERLMIEKNVYHRTCLRCARCNSQLTPGNFYETEIDGEYCCETCPDEEKKLDVATSSKDRTVEPVKSISVRLASFEKDGTKVLQKSLSDEEKSQSLKKLTENQLQYIYKPNSARSNFLNNPSSGEYDSRNSSRRNSDSSIDTTSSDKTNDDVSKVPPELPKSLPPLLSKDETQASSSFHIQESIRSTIEDDSKTTPEIPHLRNIQVETIICDMPSEPSVVVADKIESKTKSVEIENDTSGAIPKQERKIPDMESIQIKTFINNDSFPNQMATLRLLGPPTIRCKGGENEKTFSLHREFSDIQLTLVSTDTMDSKFQDPPKNGSNFESTDKPQYPETNLNILTTKNEETTGIKKDVCEETSQQIDISDMRNIQIEQQITNSNIEGMQTGIHTLSQDSDFKSQNSLEEYLPQTIQIPNMKDIRLETDICDSTSLSQQSLESLDPSTRSRFKSSEVIKELHSEISDIQRKSCECKYNDSMELEFEEVGIGRPQSLQKTTENIEITTIKCDKCGETSQMKTGILLPETNEIYTLSQELSIGSSKKSSMLSIDKTQTETPKLSTGPFDQQQDNSVESCNDLNLIKHSINVTKDNSENDGEMRTIDECNKKLPTTDAEQPVVDSESSKSMVRARLHQFENIANKSQNSSISSLSKNRLSQSTNNSSICNTQLIEKELNTINLQADTDSPATDLIANEMKEHTSYISTEKRPEKQSDSSEDMRSCLDELSEFDKLHKCDASHKSEKSDNSDKLEKSDTPDQLDKPDNLEKLETSDTSDKLDKPDNSEKLEKSNISGQSDKPDNSEKLEQLDKSDKPDNLETFEKSDKSDKPDNSEKLEKSNISVKSDKPDNSEKLEQSDKSDKPDNSETFEKSDKSDKQDNSDKSDKSEKLEKSDTLDKSALKDGIQKKKSDDYPEELNPFKSDEEEDNQSSQKKTNPFESSDEDEKKSESKVAPSNPFGSESEDDNVSSRSGKLPVPTPRITKSSEKVASVVTQLAMLRSYEGPVQNTQECCCCAGRPDQDVRSSQKSMYCTCSRGVTKNRKKKPAPQPPKVSKEIFSSINQDSKKSSPGSSTASTPTTVRKKRPAPSPPGQSKTEGGSSAKKDLLLTSMESSTSAQEEVKIEKPQTQLEKLCDEEKALLESSTNISSNDLSSITLDQGNESTKTSKRRLIALDASLVEDANASEDLKLKEEDNVIYRRTLVPPVLDDSTLSPSSDTSESHDRQLEKMKDNKEAKNRNRQSQISLPSEENDPLYNKSVHGKWKRRKGPAPALPIPPKKVLQMLPLQEIRHELEIIEVQQQGLEKQGVMLEKMIRERCEGPAGGDNIEGNPNPPNSKEVEDLILQLFELVNEKNELFRRQAELMYLRRQHRLEQEQADLEYEIRVLMAQPERNKTDSDKAREEALIARLVEVVQLRNEVVECLEMDRLREAEEDLSIKQRLEMHSAKRDEELSKQTPTKLSKKEKKKQKEHKKIGKSKKLDADKDADESELNAEKQKAKKKKKKFLF